MKQAGVALLAVAAAAVEAAPCGDTLDPKLRQQVAGNGVTLAWVSRPTPPPIDRHFQLDIAVCGAPIAALRVDADMPAHRHGMNYRTTVTSTGEGRFSALGLMFHMPGRWRLIFDVDTGDRTQRLTQEFEVR